MQEKINEDLKPNEIKIRITGSDRLKALDASYIKYHFFYLEGSTSEFVGKFPINLDEKEYTHTVPQKDFANVWKGLKDREISFTLKKQVFILTFIKHKLDTQTVKLTSLGLHSSCKKTIMLKGCDVTVFIELQKPIKGKEMEKVTVMKKFVDRVLPPFELPTIAKPQ